MNSLRLYEEELSSECYKVRLLLGFLGVAAERIAIETYPGREHEQPAFLAVNPLGQLPVIDDDGWILRDAHAILVYLAEKHGATASWYSREPKALGSIHQWLALAAHLDATAGAARLHESFFYPCDLARCQAQAHRSLRVLEQHLWFAEQRGEHWLCAGALPTIADIGCFPAVILSEEGGISRLTYPAVRRWTDRFKRIDGFVPMPGVFAASAAGGGAPA